MFSLPRSSLLSFGRALFDATGVEGEVADSWLTVALGRDARGDFARGLGRLPTLLERVITGRLLPRLEARFTPLTALSGRVGIPEPRHWPDQVGQSAARHAIVMAREQGIGLVAFPKPAILGAALLPVADAGMLGVAFVQNAPLLRTPDSGRENHVGNNPVAFCAPAGKDMPPFLFDGALSRYSLFDLLDAAERGEPLPPDAVVGPAGEPADDPPAVMRALADGNRSSGGLPPLGGHKGLGMAMAVEFIAGALTGGFGTPPSGKPWGEGALVIVLSSHLFGLSAEELSSRISQYLDSFDVYPGKRSADSPLLAYPPRVLERLNDAAASRGLSARLVPEGEDATL